MEKQENQRVELNTKEIEMPKIDLTPYVGKKAKIVDAGTYKGNYGYYAKFETAVLDTVEGGKDPVEIKASVIFGLFEDGNGNIGWGKETKLGLFLAKYKAEELNDMVGKEVLIQTKANKEGVEFLTLV